MRVLVVHCHPLERSLASAARDRVLAGLGRAGHEVRLLDLYAEGFDPVFTAAERIGHLDPPWTKDAVVQRHAEQLAWCEAVVFVYPTWWSGQPAMLTGWFDRVLLHGMAWDLPAGANRLKPGLHNVRRIVVVTSHGSRKWINALEGEGGKRVILRAFRVLCHPVTRCTWLAIYDLDNANDQKCRAFLDRVESRMARLSRWR
jgi:NAD(P)H dehydrogenase (quinone)